MPFSCCIIPLFGCIALRFQHLYHLVSCGSGAVLLEKSRHNEDGVAHADLRHAVETAVSAKGAAVFICHRRSFLRFLRCNGMGDKGVILGISLIVNPIS